MIKWFRAWRARKEKEQFLARYKRQVKEVKNVLRNMAISQKRMGWNRVKRRQFWREFIKKDIESMINAMEM